MRQDNRSRRIALCAMISALALIFLFASYLPYLLIAAPAFAGFLFAILTIEINRKWAVGAFCATALMTLLFCEKESAILFVFFFGYYPILKGKLEQLPSRILEYFLKFTLFNFSIVSGYLVLIFLFSIPAASFGFTGIGMLAILLICANIVMLVYDVALSRMISVYWVKLHPKLKNIIK